eukprot:448253-Prorocentrum_minimum.AAC.1
MQKRGRRNVPKSVKSLRNPRGPACDTWDEFEKESCPTLLFVISDRRSESPKIWRFGTATGRS